MKSKTEEIVSRISDLRREYQMKEILDALDISYTTVSYWRRGLREVSKGSYPYISHQLSLLEKKTDVADIIERIQLIEKELNSLKNLIFNREKGMD